MFVDKEQIIDKFRQTPEIPQLDLDYQRFLSDTGMIEFLPTDDPRIARLECLVEELKESAKITVGEVILLLYGLYPNQLISDKRLAQAYYGCADQSELEALSAMRSRESGVYNIRGVFGRITGGYHGFKINRVLLSPQDMITLFGIWKGEQTGNLATVNGLSSLIERSGYSLSRDCTKVSVCRVRRKLSGATPSQTIDSEHEGRIIKYRLPLNL